MRTNFRLAVAAVTFLVFTSQPVLAQKGNLFNQLVDGSRAELEKKGGKLKMALDWPEEDAKPVLPHFQKAFPFIKQIDYVRETRSEPFGRYLVSAKQGVYPEYDIMHVASEFQAQYLKEGLFVKPRFDYKELNKFLPKEWGKIDDRAIDPKGYFLGTTGNARGHAWNPTLVPKGKEPTTWEACLDPMWKGKVVYDSRGKLESLQHDPKTRERTLKWLRGLRDNNVVLLRGQATVLQKVASGEFPIACAVNYHTTFRMIDQGVKTLAFAFADPIPLEIGTRLYIPSWSQVPATTQLFAVWLATAGGEFLEKHAYRGFPWDPKSKKYPMAKGKYIALCDAECAEKWEFYEKEHAELLGIPAAK
ncbi:MAG TPA: ABC transporter substrate-binding protein [Candidatus Acidoferrales bacterium]|nr:ABC transporter substrate-binding protein [Candidatus Acidoferrales bacterium]